MAYRKLLILGVFVLLVLAALFVRIGGQKVEPHPDTPPYGLPGPYMIGTRDLATGGDTPLEMTVWYPASNEDNRRAAVTYLYQMKIGAPFGDVAIAAFKGQAVDNAPYDRSASPYPLVILSPGFSIGSAAYGWLAEHLASYGFVVISPDHSENLDPENQLWRAAITRPQDILAVLAYADEQTGSGGAFEGLIDTERVAVVGHSYGGYTALAAAGARIDTDSFEAHCQRAYEEGDPSAWLCDALLPHVADMADLAGLDSIPEGLWPVWADPRVDAAVSLAGDAFFFGETGLAEITVPVMAIGGTADQDSPYMWGTHPTYEYVSSPAKVRIALGDAAHMIFTGPCERSSLALRLISGEFCSDPGWDRQYAHGLIGHFTTAFLLTELNQDADAAAALAPDGVEFSGMTYEAQGY